MTKFDEIIRQQGRKKNWLAAHIGLTPSEFTQKSVGYRGRRFSEQERATLALLLGVPEAELFAESAEAQPL